MSGFNSKTLREKYEQERQERAEISRLMYWSRLVSCHGEERAKAIVDGKDEATLVDIAAWRNIGGRK